VINTSSLNQDGLLKNRKRVNSYTFADTTVLENVKRRSGNMNNIQSKIERLRQLEKMEEDAKTDAFADVFGTVIAFVAIALLVYVIF